MVNLASEGGCCAGYTRGVYLCSAEWEEERWWGGLGLEMVQGDNVRGVTSRKGDKQQQRLRFVPSLEALSCISQTPVMMQSLFSTNDNKDKAAQVKQLGTQLSAAREWVYLEYVNKIIW